MNKVKRGLQLSAGIVGICFSALLVLGSTYLLSYTGSLLEVLGEYGAIFGGEIYTVLIIVMILSFVNTAICALLCRNKPALDVAIAALVLNGIFLLLYLASLSWYIIFPIAIVGLLIASLCIKDTAVANVTPSDAPVASTKNETAGISEKIEQLKQLHESGLITEAELKEFVKKELSK